MLCWRWRSFPVMLAVYSNTGALEFLHVFHLPSGLEVPGPLDIHRTPRILPQDGKLGCGVFFGISAPSSLRKKRARRVYATIDDFDKVEVLGFGSTGVVSKARHPGTGETFAVKAIRGDGEGGYSPAGLRDAACLDACRGHPSVVQMHGVEEDGATGDLFIFMELVGPSLRGRLTRPHSEAVTRAYMRQLLGAAERMHAAGMGHRHISPENILVGPGGALKLCGFGMATTATDPATEAYPDGDVQLQYCSPQQLLGMRYNSPAVDMWALGCVMDELLAGEPLIVSETDEEMFEEMECLEDEFMGMDLEVFDDYVRLPGLSVAGREVLYGLLRFDDDERITAADALRHRWFAEDHDKAPAVAKADAEHPVSAAAED